MPEFTPRHLVIVRHGESEGDVRRAFRREGKAYESQKHPADERQTELGNEQSIAAGKWIASYVLENYGIRSFDTYVTSPMVRTKQSAVSLGLSQEWKEDPLLTERDRGKVQGLTRSEHRSLYPESYEQMNMYPFHWVPPDGESILKVAGRAARFIEQFKTRRNILVETHRDWMWAAHIPLDGMSIDEALAVDTDEIHNGQILHYTNVDPQDRRVYGDSFRWKRSVCPWVSDAEVIEASCQWIEIGTISK